LNIAKLSPKIRRIPIPTFDYICNNPDCHVETFESFSGFNEAPLAKCDTCGELTQKRLISGGSFLFIKGFKTLGSLADENRKKMGQYTYDKKMKEKKEREIAASKFVGETFNGGKPRERSVGDKDYIPPWRETKKIDKSLERLAPPIISTEKEPPKIDVKTAEEAHRYIMTGKKGPGLGPLTV
jgi:predicted nucleic acid-binding Zn ribbon protein